jgi:S-adenosylmethionine:tRNA ribosyltransferase-isomerase
VHLRTSDFDYDLPRCLIAQEPLPERTQARMLVVDRSTCRLGHARVSDLPEYLSAGDLLVVNETQVIPARLFGRRLDTGGKVEVLLVEPAGDAVWEAMLRASGRPRTGVRLELAGGQIRAEVVAGVGQGRVRLRLNSVQPLLEVLGAEGTAPVPPYIRRPAGRSDLSEMDRSRYQTVFARIPGAVAAPTAGLHFDEDLLRALAEGGVERTAITLHVGPGTFRPVKTDSVADHDMETERYVVDEGAAVAVNAARERGSRIVAVGSTTVRTCETVAAKHRGSMAAESGRTSLFIYPPYKFLVTDVLLTNFHLPRSTLLMMVCALAGRELTLNAYSEAVREKYRFYSYGDCMLVM